MGITIPRPPPMGGEVIIRTMHSFGGCVAADLWKSRVTYRLLTNKNGTAEITLWCEL